jgi:hypothetical protein
MDLLNPENPRKSVKIVQSHENLEIIKTHQRLWKTTDPRPAGIQQA